MNKILGKKILIVTAHPDDESFGAAGTMLRNHENGGASYVACATFGEKGKSHIKTKITSRQLKRRRKKELLAASKYLKVSGLLLPGLPDTQLGKKSNQDAFFKKLLPFVEKVRPAFIISFGSDGISGHIDHIAVGKVAKRVAKVLKIPLLTFSMPPQLYKSMEALKSRRKHGRYVKVLKYCPPDIQIKIDPEKKLKALHYHRSQFEFEEPFAKFSAKTIKQILNREYFCTN